MDVFHFLSHKVGLCEVVRFSCFGVCSEISKTLVLQPIGVELVSGSSPIVEETNQMFDVAARQRHAGYGIGLFNVHG